MEAKGDKILHNINGKYYIEHVDYTIEPIILADDTTTAAMLDRATNKQATEIVMGQVNL